MGHLGLVALFEEEEAGQGVVGTCQAASLKESCLEGAHTDPCLAGLLVGSNWNTDELDCDLLVNCWLDPSAVLLKFGENVPGHCTECSCSASCRCLFFFLSAVGSSGKLLNKDFETSAPKETLSF